MGKVGYLIIDDDPDFPEVKFTTSEEQVYSSQIQGILTKKIVYFEVEDE